MNRFACVAVAFFALSAPALAAETPPRIIGVATMQADGTIVMRLGAHGAGGITGDATMTVRPSDPNYQEILSHIGPMKPGDSKPVPAWPDEPSGNGAAR